MIIMISRMLRMEIARQVCLQGLPASRCFFLWLAHLSRGMKACWHVPCPNRKFAGSLSRLRGNLAGSLLKPCRHVAGIDNLLDSCGDFAETLSRCCRNIVGSLSKPCWNRNLAGILLRLRRSCRDLAKPCRKVAELRRNVAEILPKPCQQVVETLLKLCRIRNFAGTLPRVRQTFIEILPKACRQLVKCY